jgi:hypothetical protein
MRSKILGKCWRIVRERFRNSWGHCDAPNIKNKAIYIDPKIRGEHLLEIILHETLHAAGWHIDEEFVEELARDQARLIYKLGFRQVE